MRILFVSSEIFPLAKTGGLADVSHSLPAALAGLGVDMRLLMPAYPEALERAEQVGAPIALGNILGFEAALLPARLPGSGLPVWLLDSPQLFARIGRLYTDHDGRDWRDNHLRFALLSHVGAQLAMGRTPLDWQADAVHVNDWHTGLLPLLLKRAGATAPPSLMTIHNISFQGVFGLGEAGRLDIPAEHLTADGVEFYGNISYLKAGIRYADKVTTVSPSYARQVTTQDFGWGMHGLLAARRTDFSGILNGVDYDLWNPAHDPLIPAHYAAGDMSGKHTCKAVLRAQLGLDEADVPVFGYMSRLTEQKMADHVLAVAPAIAEGLGQLVVVAEGERHFEDGLRELAACYPGRVAVVIGYSEELAHRLLAGSDVLLAPARFEPCGLTHLYAMRYGTPPVAHHTGGLADTITCANEANLAARTATGFCVRGWEEEDLLDGIKRAEALFRQPLAWRRLIETAMQQDFSWSRSARSYLGLYAEMASAREDRAAPKAREARRRA